MSSLKSLLGLALLLSLAWGCAATPAAFSTRFGDNDDTNIDNMLQRVRNAPPRSAGTIAVFVTPDPKRLCAYDLAQNRLLWQQPTTATSAPILAGDLAIFQTASSVVGVSLQSGARAFEHDRDSKMLRGADGEGALSVFVLSEGMGSYAKSEVVLARRGSIDWKHAFEGTVGVPAVVGNLVLVPWSNQYLTAIDAESGKEVARARVRDGVIAHAFRDREHTYVGSLHGMTKVSESIGSGTLKGAGYFTVPDITLPGRPRLLRDVYTEVAPPTPDSAQHRIALAWEPQSLDQVRMGLDQDTAYLVFYRFVLALDAKSFDVRWVHVTEHDIVGSAAQPGGVIVAQETGEWLALAARSGEVSARFATSLPASVVELPVGAQSIAPGEAQDPATHRARLLAAAQDTDSRVVPARVLVVQALGKLDDAEATASLITLCDDPSLTPPVKAEACSLLSKRELGAEQLLATLERHAAFLTNTTAPPVGALAKAAVTLNEKRAVAPLITHLNDPATPSRDLPALVTALGDLGDPSAAAPLASFLLLYHADAIDEHLVSALERIPTALSKLDVAAAKPALERVSGDEQGIFPVRTKARDALAAIHAQELAEQKAKEAAAAPAETPAEPAAPVPAEQLLPTHLTTELIEQALLPVRDQLQTCVRDHSRNLFQARAVLVIEDGSLLMVSVVPPELQSCVEPLMRSQKFSPTRYPKKERVTYIIKRGG